jgi:hypothetical protein
LPFFDPALECRQDTALFSLLGTTASMAESSRRHSNPGDSLDYGNVSYTRKHRFLGTFLYDLPFGKGRLLGANANGFLDRIIGGWELAGVLLFESGPFLTVTAPGTDPSGTGFDFFNAGRADIVSGVPLYPAGRNIYNWINTASLALPANNTGTWPAEGVGTYVGPGTQAVSLSLFKAVPINGRVRMQLGVAATNMLNHPN